MLAREHCCIFRLPCAFAYDTHCCWLEPQNSPESDHTRQEPCRNSRRATTATARDTKTVGLEGQDLQRQHVLRREADRLSAIPHNASGTPIVPTTNKKIPTNGGFSPFGSIKEAPGLRKNNLPSVEVNRALLYSNEEQDLLAGDEEMLWAHGRAKTRVEGKA